MTPIKTSEFSLNPHIIGGKLAVLGQLPWQVSMQLHKSDGYYFCGGVIVHSKWVLTAAHCTMDTFEIVIRLGSIDRRVIAVQFLINENDIKQHPEFKLQTIANDISLLKTPKIEFTNNIRPIRILPKTYCKSLSKTLVTSGWGKTCDAPSCKLVPILNFALVTPISNDECKTVWEELVTFSTVCTLGINGGNQEPCRGDSGGPLVQLGKDKYLIGLSSFGAQFCEEGWPSVYTRVNEFCDWMKDVTSLTFC